MEPDQPRLSPALRDRVLDRLGLASSPAADLGGLRALYGAWCAGVPFDNVRKMIALFSGDRQPLPGSDATDFFEHWLADGCGGTCWPTSNALFELVTAVGFPARRVVGSMRDIGIVNHASIKVALDGRDWLIDSSMLTNDPLPLTDVAFVNRDPVFAVEIEPAGDSHVIWFDVPPHAEYYPCRLIAGDSTRTVASDAYERSRTGSAFNQALYARHNRPGAMIVLRGRTRFVKTAAGVEQRELSGDEIVSSLQREIGISESLVNQWVSAGGLEASLAPVWGPVLPPINATRPSRRYSHPSPAL
jgi:N-hydroxyarylamine O-acetyltransferase